MKKNVLIAYSALIVGGATTSLLSFLHALDYSRYNVDLQLYENTGVRQSEIPKEVHILPQAKMHHRFQFKNIWQRIASSAYRKAAFQATFLRKFKKNRIAKNQLMWKAGVAFSRRPEKSYAIALSYMEFWSFYYVAHFVQAPKKLTWIHVDYAESGMLPEIDTEEFAIFDSLIFVSQKCLENFQKLCPQFANKSVYIANLMEQSAVRAAAKKRVVELPFLKKDKIKLLTICRIQFSHKGLDRGVEALRQLKESGIAQQFQWIIIGDGADRSALEKMIVAYGLTDIVSCLGQQTQPLPYALLCDAFFLPSRFEGKPMAVTEAQMVGLPVLVTTYASAPEQIEVGKDGLLWENSTDGIVHGLQMVAQNPNLLVQMRQWMTQKDYSNREEIEKIYARME